MKYVKGFDTIRAYAVFLVIISHWGPYFGNRTIWGFLKETFVPDGAFGVNLFFVLSGFLISSILLNEKVKNTEGKPFKVVKNFYVRRFLRIFPIYYLVIFLCYIMNFTFVKEYIWYFATYLSNYVPMKYMFNSPLVHTWSLAVEEQFYLIWPWIIIFVSMKYLRYVLIAFIIIGIVSYIQIVHGTGTNVFCFFSSFGFGALYAYFRLNEASSRKFEKAFIIIFPLLLFLAFRMRSYQGLTMCIIYFKTVDSLIGVALIMFALNNNSKWARKYILENSVFNYLGKISYGLYLYHYPWGIFYDFSIKPYFVHMPEFVTSYYFSWFMKLAGLMIISSISYKYIELPILSLKKKFEYGRKKEAALVSIN